MAKYGLRRRFGVREAGGWLGASVSEGLESRPGWEGGFLGNFFPFFLSFFFSKSPLLEGVFLGNKAKVAKYRLRPSRGQA